jgi:hypothetical protein
MEYTGRELSDEYQKWGLPINLEAIKFLRFSVAVQKKYALQFLNLRLLHIAFICGSWFDTRHLCDLEHNSCGTGRMKKVIFLQQSSPTTFGITHCLHHVKN